MTDTELERGLNDLIERYLHDDRWNPPVLIDALSSHLAYALAHALVTRPLAPDEIDLHLDDFCTKLRGVTWTVIHEIAEAADHDDA
jgi:hypothetical protein